MKVDTVIVIVLVLVLVWLWLNRPERFAGLDDALLDQERHLPQWDDQDIAELERKIRDAANESRQQVRSEQEDALKYDSEKKDDGTPAATSAGEVESNLTEMFSAGHISSAFSPIDQFSVGQFELEMFSPVHVLDAQVNLNERFSPVHVLDAQVELANRERAMNPEDRVRAALFDRRNQ